MPATVLRLPAQLLQAAPGRPEPAAARSRMRDGGDTSGSEDEENDIIIKFCKEW